MSNDKESVFVETPLELRKWFKKNHKKTKEVWVRLYKSSSKMSDFTQKDAVDVALCFGWAIATIRSVDHISYELRFTKRKPKSQWSSLTVKRFLELKKMGKVDRAGLEAFKDRDASFDNEKMAKLTPKQLKRFKANKKAWAFFSKQRDSYRKYTVFWVNCCKREETKDKRLAMLIEDSADDRILKRIAEAHAKLQKKYEPGRTPIEAGRNIGPITGAELRSIGIETVEQLRQMGWEEGFYKLCEMYPNRVNLNMAVGLIGVVEDVDWRKLSPALKAEAKAIIRQMKRGF